jgi:hypothetical protein
MRIQRLGSLILAVFALASLVQAADQPATLQQVVDRIFQREQEQVKGLAQYSPLVETYIQNVKKDADQMVVPVADRYFVGKLSLSDGSFDEHVFMGRQGIVTKTGHKIGDKLNLFGVKYNAAGFSYEIFPDQNSFDRNHYDMNFIQREFLGDVRTLVFDVAPKPSSGNGRFLGRIWVEDKDYTIVRFNGTYAPKPRTGMFFHFDSWRVNTVANMWAPAYIYTEESDALYGVDQHMSMKAQTRIWGYNSHGSNKDSEFSEILIDSPNAKDQSVAAQDASPLEGRRAFERMAEDNVLRKMESVGLLAPSGELDKILQTVVNNLEITNKLDIQPEVRCRVLLTTPLESFSVGHTIVISRGLVDVLPDEASLAMVLSRELAHISLGHHFDTRYAFSDRLSFADEKAYQALAFGHTEQEEQEADAKAADFLKNSPYADKLAAAGLFLRALESRAPALAALNEAHLGTPLVQHGHVVRLAALLGSAPQLEVRKLDQIAALPLGGRVKLNPWTNAVALVKTAPLPIMSAADKMPFEVTPFLPHIQRAGTTNDTSVASAGTK